jgi:hypothetical protein
MLDMEDSLQSKAREYRGDKDISTIQWQTTVYFAVGIASIGAVMMTLTSSPTAKGASFLWLPAALQLMAGVWLGPWRGFLAAGLGAYAAGILAYGGWGIVDIIMNPVAGGLANGALPALLFRWFRIDPTLGAGESSRLDDILKGAARIFILLAIVLIAAFIMQKIGIGTWGYIPPLLLLFFIPLLLKDMKVRRRDFIAGFFVCVIISLISALIGGFGQVVGGQTWQGALIGTSLGWFLGDTVSAILGLYMLAAFTQRAREWGIATI